MAKSKNILGYAFDWLTKGEAEKVEQLKAFIEETVKKAVSEAIGELLTKAEVGKSLFEALKLLGVDDINTPKPAGELYPGENPFAV